MRRGNASIAESIKYDEDNYLLRTAFLESISTCLLRLFDPTPGTEECVTMGTKSAELMGSQLVAAYTDQDHANETTIRELSRFDEETVPPESKELIYKDAHIPLYFVRVLFLWAGHDTSEYHVCGAISSSRISPSRAVIDEDDTYRR